MDVGGDLAIECLNQQGDALASMCSMLLSKGKVDTACCAETFYFTKCVALQKAATMMPWNFQDRARVAMW